MRSLTAIALALAILGSMATADAATTQKKHHRKHHSAQMGKKAHPHQTAKSAPREKAPATK